MSYVKFQPGAVVTVSDYAGLRAAARASGGLPANFS
jgi:hypothetical protein